MLASVVRKHPSLAVHRYQTRMAADGRSGDAPDRYSAQEIRCCIVLHQRTQRNSAASGKRMRTAVLKPVLTIPRMRTILGRYSEGKYKLRILFLLRRSRPPCFFTCALQERSFSTQVRHSQTLWTYMRYKSVNGRARR